ncbi:MAG: hypothetical protein H0X38_09095 [Planctomycetes bacterium]|nr:hypothetical protein [Planctomycetota bacterium]
MPLPRICWPLATLGLVLMPLALAAECGDPQVMTDDPWYSGELSCSTFPRLFKTEAEVYKRVTGRGVDSDEDKALAAWYWRNLHFAHGEEGHPDTFDRTSHSAWNREYWTGLYGFGFGICGTTHSQWTAEMQQLLGPFRGRVAGVEGHNSFEVYLTGGAYGQGDWALLDHDVSTVIFSDDGSRMLGITAIRPQITKYANPDFTPGRNHGWRVAGLAASDATAYAKFNTAEYGGGYSGPPPTVHLRAGESMRRYLAPGLGDGRTFVFWGRNYDAAGIPGPSRRESWVNQPEKMYQAAASCPPREGQVRYGNAAYTYVPDFAAGGYQDGVIDEAADHVTFEFYTPYVIGCTPADTSAWGIYAKGGRNGLVLAGRMTCAVSVSTDQGRTWEDGGAARDGLDLTDLVKGRQQYWIRFAAGPAALATSGLTLRTVCACNSTIIPHLHDGDNRITFLASETGVISAGPNKDQAEGHVVEGALGSAAVTLELATPRHEQAVHVYAASWEACGCPPKAGVKYQIEVSTDAGRNWKSVVKDWEVIRHDPEPGDWWSQSMTYGDVALDPASGPVRVRFTNNGGKPFLKVEAHLVYQVRRPGPVEVTFSWADDAGPARTASHAFAARAGQEDRTWSIPAGKQVKTLWVEYAAR